MLVEAKQLLEVNQAKPVGKYFGSYGDIVYLHTKTNALYCITLQPLAKNIPQYRTILEQLDATLQEGFEILEQLELPSVYMFDEFEQRRELILIRNVHPNSVVMQLETEILQEDIEPRIYSHINAIRNGK